MKRFWFDVETTGLVHYKHSIIQLACMVEIDGQVVEEREFKMAPIPGRLVEQEALDTHGYSLEELLTWPDPKMVRKQLLALMGKYVDPYAKREHKDAFVPSGFNVGFDMDMLKGFWEWDGDRYLYSWFRGTRLDAHAALGFLQVAGVLPVLPSNKLTDIAAYLGINTDGAHNALADIRMTRKVTLALLDRIKR